MVHEETPVIVFTAESRCDGCGSQAYAQAEKDSDLLLFCGHHIKVSREALLNQGWTVTEDAEGLRELYEPYPTPV